jgi:hypothetical protein
MMHEPDGVGEAVEELLRSGLAAAGALARAHAQARAEQLRAAAEASEQAARQVRATMEVDRAAARARLATVTQKEWWDRATPQEIAGAWETAQDWRETDPEAAKASVRIRAELEDRYGIDPHDYTPSQPAGVAPASEPASVTSPVAAAAVEALREVTDGRRLAAISHQGSVAESLLRGGGPSSPPRARRGRGRGQQRVEREQSR